MAQFTSSNLRSGAPPPGFVPRGSIPPGFAPRGFRRESRIPLAPPGARVKFFRVETETQKNTANTYPFCLHDDTGGIDTVAHTVRVGPKGYLTCSGKPKPVAKVFGILPPACLLTANMHEPAEDLNVPEPVIFAAIMRGFGEGFVSWLLGDRLPALLLTWPKPLLWHLVLQTLKYLACTDPESLWLELTDYHNHAREPSKKLRACLLRVLDPEERRKRLAEVTALLKEFKSGCGQMTVSSIDLLNDPQMKDYFQARCGELLSSYKAAAATAADPKKFALVSYFAAKTALTEAINKCKTLEALLAYRLSARALLSSWTSISEAANEELPAALKLALTEHIRVHLLVTGNLTASKKLPTDDCDYVRSTAIYRRLIAIIDYCRQVQRLGDCIQRTQFPSVKHALEVQVGGLWQRAVVLLHDGTEAADIKLLLDNLETQIRSFD